MSSWVYFEEFLVGPGSGEFLFFDRGEFLFHLFVGDGDVEFFRLAHDPSPIDQFAHDPGLDFLVFVAARLRVFFQFRFGDLPLESAVEVLFGDVPEVVRHILDDRYLVGGNAGGTDPLRHRETDEEQDQEATEEDQP
jgi:hypothetical protein